MLFSYDTDILPKVRMIGKINYIKPWIHFARTANEFILYVIREGEMFLEEDGIRYQLKKGDFFLLEPELFHKGYREASCSYYYVHFKHSGLRRVHPKEEEQAICDMLEKRKISLLSYSLDEKDPTDPYALFQKQDSIIDYQDTKGILNLAVSIYNRREEHYKRMASVELHRFLMNTAHAFVLNHSAVKTGSSVKKSVVKVDGILNYLNSNYMHKITSEMLEEKFEVNFDYINRVFTERNGDTIFHYLNSIRISHAKELISTTNLNFSEVAYLTGIEDAYYFTKIFKKYCGMTPTQYYQYCSSEAREDF
jgi:YesN/AraC family two-component response regulator